MEKIEKLKEEKLSIETLGENFKSDKAKIQGKSLWKSVVATERFGQSCTKNFSGNRGHKSQN